jgi:hypothetical protein
MVSFIERYSNSTPITGAQQAWKHRFSAQFSCRAKPEYPAYAIE